MLNNGDEESPVSRGDLILYQNQKLKRMSILHPAYDPLVYVLMFPHGDDGWTVNIPYRNVNLAAVLWPEIDNNDVLEDADLAEDDQQDHGDIDMFDASQEVVQQLAAATLDDPPPIVPQHIEAFPPELGADAMDEDDHEEMRNIYAAQRHPAPHAQEHGRDEMRNMHAVERNPAQPALEHGHEEMRNNFAAELNMDPSEQALEEIPETPLPFALADDREWEADPLLEQEVDDADLLAAIQEAAIQEEMSEEEEEDDAEEPEAPEPGDELQP